MSYTDKICNTGCEKKEHHHSNSIPVPVVVNYNTTCQTNDCNCDPIYSYQPEPTPLCNVAPMAYADTSVPVQYNSAKYGISDPSAGLNQSFIVGLGLESRVRYDSLSVDTQYNLIPWYWNDYSAFDPSLPFTPKKWDYEGLSFETPERNRLIVKDCNGIVIKDVTAPVLGGGGGGFTVRITDTQPLTDASIPVAPGQTLVIDAGDGIDLVPINSGFRIVNSSPAGNLSLQPAPNSGIVITGGANGVPYTIGVDCGTLRNNCGLVRSVNGNLPDSNGNVSISSTGGSGVSAITNSDQTLTITYPSTGVVGIDINCANLRSKCNFVTTTNQGLAGQILVNNGNGTATWTDLCIAIANANCSGGSSVAAPTNGSVAQAPANGGANDGSTPYTCGNPLLKWTASTTPNTTYEIREGGTVLVSNLFTTSSTLAQAPTPGAKIYSVYAKSGDTYSAPLNISVTIADCQNPVAPGDVYIGTNGGDVNKVNSTGFASLLIDGTSGTVYSDFTGDTQGNIYALNATAGIISKISSGGTITQNYINTVSAVKASKVINNVFYTTDSLVPNRINKIDLITNTSSSFAILTSNGSLSGGDVEVDSLGNIYSSYGASGQIHKISSSGNITQDWANVGASIVNSNILILNNNTLVVHSSSRIYTITPAGTVATLYTVPTGQAIGSIATDGTNVYYAVTTENILYKVTPSGTQSVFAQPIVSGGVILITPYINSNGDLFTVNNLGFVTKITSNGASNSSFATLTNQFTPFAIYSK